MLKANAELETRVRERTAQLEHLNRELEAFTSSVSHDLRAPLRALDGYAALLAEEAERLDEDGRRHLAAIRRNVRRMSELVESLLALSRAGRQPLRTGPIDMERLARSVLDELLVPGEREKTEVVFRPLPAAVGDESLVRQVLANVVGNALKFSGRKDRRRLEIGARNEGGRTFWFVSDDGMGFEPAQAERIFRIFERLPGAEGFEGTGVGLAVVRRIVERHGGVVRAEGRPAPGRRSRSAWGTERAEGRSARERLLDRGLEALRGVVRGEAGDRRAPGATRNFVKFHLIASVPRSPGAAFFSCR